MNRNIMKMAILVAGIGILASVVTLAFSYSRNASMRDSSEDPAVILAEGYALPTGFTALALKDGNLEGTYGSITFQTRRGPRTPDVLRRTVPTTPQFEVDVRFLNEDSVPFLLQIGGHEPVDSAWATSLADTELSVLDEADEARVRAQLTTAESMVQAIRAVQFRSNFAPEYEALLNLEPLIQSLQPTDKIGEAEELSACTFRNKIAIHDQPCCFYLGRHSGTIARNIAPNGTTTQAWAACNHGTCPQQMPLKCQWTSGADRCALASAPTCSTPYSALSCCGGHNCNDDSDMQYASVRLAYDPHPQLGTCKDAARNDQATTCY